MRGRLRCCIITAFSLAFFAQLAVVFVFFPSSSISIGPLLDESAFPASPALRSSPKTSQQTRSGSSTSVIGTQQQIQSVPTALPLSMLPSSPTSLTIVGELSFASTVVVTAAPEQPSLAPSNRGPQYDLVHPPPIYRSSHSYFKYSYFKYHNFPYGYMSKYSSIACLCCGTDYWNQHRCSLRKPRLSLEDFKGVASERVPPFVLV